MERLPPISPLLYWTEPYSSMNASTKCHYEFSPEEEIRVWKVMRKVLTWLKVSIWHQLGNNNSIECRKVIMANHTRCSFVIFSYYRPRSREDNTFGSVRPSICPSIRLSVCTLLPAKYSKRSSETQVGYTLKIHQSVFITRSIRNGWAFKVVVVSTGCAITVDHAFTSFRF